MRAMRASSERRTVSRRGLFLRRALTARGFVCLGMITIVGSWVSVVLRIYLRSPFPFKQHILFSFYRGTKMQKMQIGTNLSASFAQSGSLMNLYKVQPIF